MFALALNRFFVLSASLLFALSSVGWAKTVLLETAETQAAPAPLREFLESAKLELVDPAQFPEIFRSTSELEAMVERIHSVQPVAKNLYVVILDRSSPEAYMKALPNGDAVVSISAGLLRFVRNDHELAFVLSHEMEHPNSRLEKNWSKMEHEYNLDEEDKAWVEKMVARSAETETDVRGIYHRMYKAGFNPYAAEDVLDRLVDLYGDAPSDDHTSTRSRRDAISLAIAAMRRNQGLEFSPQKNYDDTIVREIRGFLSSDEFLERQRGRIRHFLDHMNLDIDSFYEKIAANQRLSSKKFPYIEVYEPLQTEILRLGRYYFSEAETHSYLTRLHERIDDAFVEAHRKFLESKPKWLSFKQVEDYFSMLYRRFETFLPDLPHAMAGLIELENKIKAARDKLEKTSGIEKEQIESRLLALEKRLAAKKASLAKAGLAYEKIPEALYETFRENFQKEGHPARLKFEAALEPYRKDLAARNARSLADPGAYLTPEISNLIARYVAFKGYSIQNISRDWPQHQIDKTLGDAWSLFAEALGSALRKAPAAELKELERSYFTDYSVLIPSDTFKAALKTRSREAMQEYEKFIEDILRSDVSVRAKTTAVRELVYSSNLRLPEEPHQALKSKYVDIYAALLGETFLQNARGMNEPEQTLRALMSYQRQVLDLYAQAGRPDKPLISLEVYVRAKKHLFDRATEHGSVIPENMLILQDSSLLELLVTEARPAKDVLWKEFLSLPTGDQTPPGKYFRRVSFSSVVTLFDGVIPQAELFSELNNRRWLLEFDGTELTDKSKNQRLVELRREYFEYFRGREPHDFKFAARILEKYTSHFENDKVSDLRTRLFFEAIDELRKKGSSGSLRETATKFIGALYGNFNEAWGQNEIKKILRENRERWMPAGVSERIEVALAFLKYPEPLKEAFYPYYPYMDESLSPNRFLTGEQERNEASLPLLIEYWRHFTDHRGSATRNTDEIFDAVWRRTELDQRIRETELSDPKLVRNLLFDDTQFTLAEWQLKRFLNGKKSLKSRTGIRPEIAQAREFIKSQVDEANSVRNRLIAVVENTLLTNEEETKFLSEYRQSLSDPKPSKGVLAIDSIHHVAKLAQSNFQRFEILLYLTGRMDNPPSFVTERFAGLALTARRHYWNAGTATRGYAIQAFLDEKEGILSEPATTEKLYEMLLGENLKEPVIRAMFESYIDSLPNSEKVVMLSQAVAHLNTKDRKALGLKTILEFMGPLGVKVGQFLRTSGLVDRETAAELDGFLSRALPPERPEIFERFRQTFGELMPHIEVGGLIGSGSVNFVVLAKFHLPGMGDRWVAVRFSRLEAAGQVQNENKIWMSAVEKLRATKMPEALRSADIIEESRAHAMTTLSPDGAEFDLEHERKNYGKATKAYNSPRKSKTGLKVDAMKPDFKIQELVPQEFSKSVTVMEFIKHEPLEKMEPQKRQLVIEQILQAEFEALFDRGLFDPDCHPGNWLIYLLENRLVRIDYAQLRDATPAQRQSLKAILRILVQFDFSRSDVEELSRNLGSIFDGDVDFGRARGIVEKLLRSRELPSNKAPHERILFLREGLERELRAKGLKTSVRLNSFARAALSSLGRTLGFRDQMVSPDRYQELLLDAIGTSKVKIGAKSLIGKAQEFINSRIDALLKRPSPRRIDCEGLLRKK